jgi:large subunit ribosomal protein L29
VPVKIEEVKSKTDGELAYELDKMKKELFELRFKARTAGAANPSRIRQLKRTIARVHTVRHERARQARKQPRT